MEVRTLELVDFRNYERAEVEFHPNLNLVVGSNGQGKTNLLEAVYVLSALGSHRSSSTAPMVRHEAETSILRATGASKGRPVSLDAELRRAGGIRMLVNKVTIDRSAADAVLSAVLFSPEDLALTKGGPDERRRFLDHTAARVRPIAAVERQEFERVLRQRNGVLKAAQSNPRALRQMEVWNTQLSKAGAAIVSNRLNTLSQIAPRFSERYGRIADTAVVPTLTYEPSWTDTIQDWDRPELEQVLLEALEKSQSKDLERGITLVGPHRDDLRIDLDGVDARTFASQGEQRSLALSFRLAERDLVTDVRGDTPVLLLDDVFSELDEARREHLSELVMGQGQTIATSTSADGLPVAAAKTLRIESGKVLT